MYNCKKSILETDRDSEARIKASALLSLCQEAAGEHAKLMHINYVQAENNLAWILSRVVVSYNEPCTMAKELCVATSPCTAKGVTYPRQYTVSDEQNIICNVYSDWSIMDIDSRRIIRSNELSGYGEFCEEPTASVASYRKERARNVTGISPIGEITVLRHNIDCLGHMNNTHYADIALDALGESGYARGIKTLNLTYAHEAKLGDIIDIYRIDEDGDIVIQGVIRGGENNFVAKVELL